MHAQATKLESQSLRLGEAAGVEARMSGRSRTREADVLCREEE
jgi:hypothetical protein